MFLGFSEVFEGFDVLCDGLYDGFSGLCIPGFVFLGSSFGDVFFSLRYSRVFGRCF